MKQSLQRAIILFCAALAPALFGSGIALTQATQLRCGLQSRAPAAPSVQETGGKHITARGPLRILLVFASFPDDETPHPYWPAHQPPLFMQQFVDSITSTGSTGSFNLTHYFREMSLGQFALVGDVLWVESARSVNEYSSSGSYGNANSDLIRDRLDSLVDFSKYDQWNRLGDYSIINAPDGVVDMMVIVWRTTIYGYLGEASLGYKPAIPVDGKRIEMGYPESFVVSKGSGVTCEYPYGDTPERAMKTMAHELGHWLLGGPHPYSTQLASKHQFWGILCAGERFSSCMNAYERERLGWIAVPEILPDQEIGLGDFVRTGAALKYHPPNGEISEYFYIENHRKLSIFDDATLNPDDRGVWILHQQLPYSELDALRIRPSDGTWKWETAGVSPACFGQTLPVFRRGEPRVLTGESHRDQIPTQSSSVNWIYASMTDTGSVRCGASAAGEFFTGAFDTATVAVFSPSSNPNSNTWSNQPTSFSLEVVRIVDGVATVRFASNPLDASPARRYLGRNPVTSPGQLPLAWGNQWGEGQPVEPDVTSSILQRKVGQDGLWSVVYQGPATEWIDQSVRYDSSGHIRLAYRARVQDNQGKLSTWSNTLLASASGIANVEEIGSDRPSVPGLEEAFPNPFNASTRIGYWVWGPGPGTPGNGDRAVGAGHVRLGVFDLLGREVAVLVNEKREAGYYFVNFDGASLASGTYFCRLQSGGHVETKTLLLVR